MFSGWPLRDSNFSFSTDVLTHALCISAQAAVRAAGFVEQEASDSEDEGRAPVPVAKPVVKQEIQAVIPVHLKP